MTEKTEQPTPKKIRKSREEGQVAHSKDVTHVILFAAIFGYLILDAGSIARRLSEMMVLPGLVLGMDFESALSVLSAQLLRDGLRLLLPFLLIVVVLGLGAEMMQTRMLFSLKAMKPSAKKLNVVQNVKNMFGAKGWFEFFKSVVKILILSTVVVVTLHGSIGHLITLPLAGMDGVGVALQALVTAVVVKVVLVYAFIALADWIWQRQHHRKQLMMSIDEVRREFKEDEGDPHLKQERKSRHREMLESQALEQARSASVLVTNPIHLAIALRYTAGVTPLPLVTAKGEGALAASMVKAAREAGVPVMENVPLAWDLMRRASIEHYIPAELIEPVAEVLRMVRREPTQGDPL
ncbi:MAG: hypothetical protein RL522_678 [Pseudomonadota bacterium]|jgi:type III secretion protein U